MGRVDGSHYVADRIFMGGVVRSSIHWCKGYMMWTSCINGNLIHDVDFMYGDDLIHNKDFMYRWWFDTWCGTSCIGDDQTHDEVLHVLWRLYEYMVSEDEVFYVFVWMDTWWGRSCAIMVVCDALIRYLVRGFRITSHLIRIRGWRIRVMRI